jgi:hypothetical protein
MLDKNKGVRLFFKLFLNSSNEQEIINEETFTEVILCNSHHTFNKHLKPNFTNKINFTYDDYQC